MIKNILFNQIKLFNEVFDIYFSKDNSFISILYLYALFKFST